ncbi:hypothetical protein [Xanthomonas hortorum]|nr:hypothetical protein [Xanthomonas hortorum]
MDALAEALGLPVAYFYAASDPLAEVILLMSRFSAEQQVELLERLKDFAEALDRSLTSSGKS